VSIERFACFGGTCELRAGGEGAAEAVAAARRQLLDWHDRFTRFRPSSELSRLNADRREEVPARDEMLALAEAVAQAGELTGGLVDGTLPGEVAAAGYRDTVGPPLPVALALRLAPARRPAGASEERRWRSVRVDRARGVVRRPPGVALDSGGLAKGLFADMIADRLAGRPDVVVACAGDVRMGPGTLRPVVVASPFSRATLHAFAPVTGGVATSGITRRSWLDAQGRAAHHLLDPATGRPAFTGVVQATALAPTALEAELRAKAALLSGPGEAPEWLPHGGVVVHEDGSHRVVEPGALSTFPASSHAPRT
jgi:thiamine biosynthesis lipoprotein